MTRTEAKALGYYVRKGDYHGTTDNRYGRWYTGCEGHGFRPFGDGYRTQREAWEAVIEMADRLTQEAADAERDFGRRA